MTQIHITPNICSNCGWRIGPLEYEMIGDDDTHYVNYCSGCGQPVKDVLEDYEDPRGQADE